ncbi:UDP-N-acetylmuramate dehydrogenase [Pseudonocardia oceani]|uniref:UDP-N-acetylenolpyruvoylglucosamine reductase n=1 Tax=Pseudonocardia oceani TaxID=2792013 RepID=A0ABS6UAW2_9PSEU|nr:UDP-N-acetylmuramate dehydrogenase [Pseudonocardia oceani]
MAPVSTTELASLTTLRLGGPARRLVEATTADAVVDAVRAADAAGEPLLVLGGGSNVVVDDAVEQGLGGLECLSGIPGRTGATPVQNVGAYGVEIADLLVDVDLYDRRTGTVREHVPAADLGLGYRTSTLKGRDDAVVLRVRFALPGDGSSAPVRYPELARALGVEPGERVPAAAAREAVLALRRGKGMVLDDEDRDTWSAGSFFTNPIVDAAQAPEGAPRWPAGEQVKLPAAWLIQHAGFARGHAGPGGRVALSGKHVLALTHRGGGSAEDLLVLAREVRDVVRATFGVDLVPEPVLVGCRL